MHGVEVVVLEGLGGDGDDGLDQFVHRGGVVADFLLGVGVHAEGEEVEEVVEVDLPVPLGVAGDGEADAGLFAGDTFFEKLFVLGVEFFGVVKVAEEGVGGEVVDGLGAPLTVR